MPVPRKLREQVRRFLEPGDDVRYVFPADIVYGVTPSVLFVVSERAITILSTGYVSRKRPKSVVTTLPRRTALGSVETTAGIPHITVSGVLYELDDEYVAVVRAADAELGPADGLPSDPLPGL